MQISFLKTFVIADRYLSHNCQTHLDHKVCPGLCQLCSLAAYPTLTQNFSSYFTKVIALAEMCDIDISEAVSCGPQIHVLLS